MPSYSPDRTTRRKSPPTSSSEADCRPQAEIGPMELAAWLCERAGKVGDTWSAEIRARSPCQHDDVDHFIDDFVSFMVSCLPLLLGPHRRAVEPHWVRASELFGAIAAKRGLAAGEVIEEVQILRELVIRDLYRDPPLGGRRPLSLREILRLNRAIDGAVTHSSVGHIDAMFFQLFESPGQSEPAPLEEVAMEAEGQLATLRRELDATVTNVSAASYGSVEEH